MYVWYMNVYVWYGTWIVMSWCVTTCPQGGLWCSLVSRGWICVIFLLQAHPFHPQGYYFSTGILKSQNEEAFPHFHVKWTHKPTFSQIFPVILRPCLPCFWLTVQPGASSCWGSELGWLEPESWKGQFSQGKRPSSPKWYLEKNWSDRMIDVTQKSYHWILTGFRGFLVLAKNHKFGNSKIANVFHHDLHPPKLHKLLKLRLIYNASNFGVCNQDSFKKDKNPTWVGSFHISWPDSTRRYATLHPTHAGCVCLFFLAAPCGSLFDKTGRKKRPKSASVSFQLLTFSMRFDLWLLISCRLAIGKAVELDRRKTWLWLNPDKSRVNYDATSLKAEVFF